MHKYIKNIELDADESEELTSTHIKKQGDDEDFKNGSIINISSFPNSTSIMTCKVSQNPCAMEKHIISRNTNDQSNQSICLNTTNQILVSNKSPPAIITCGKGSTYNFKCITIFQNFGFINLL